jgi:hypothetical protein
LRGASEQIGAASVPTLDRIRQRQELGAVAGCGGAGTVGQLIAQHHLHGGADGNGADGDDAAVALAIQRLSERCAELGAGGDRHGSDGEWMGGELARQQQCGLHGAVSVVAKRIAFVIMSPVVPRIFVMHIQPNPRGFWRFAIAVSAFVAIDNHPHFRRMFLEFFNQLLDVHGSDSEWMTAGWAPAGRGGRNQDRRAIAALAQKTACSRLVWAKASSLDSGHSSANS